MTDDLLVEFAATKNFQNYLKDHSLKQQYLKNGYYLCGLNTVEECQIVYNYFYQKNEGVSGSCDFTTEQFLNQDTSLKYPMESGDFDLDHVRLGMKIVGEFPYWVVYKA